MLSIQPCTAESYRSICVDSVAWRKTIDQIRDFPWPRVSGQTVTVHYGNRLRAFRHFCLPSRGSAEAAEQQADRIRGLGIEDVRWIRVDYLVDGDESLQFGVSLGLYENEAAADRRHKDLAARGIAPSIRKGFNVKSWALSLETRAPSRATPEILRSWRFHFPQHPPKLDSAIPEGQPDYRAETQGDR